MPQKEKFTPYVLTDEDVKQIIKATEETELGTIIKLAIFIPARRSEICALNPQTDIVDGRFIKIDKAVVRNSFNDWVIKTTKTYESSRTVEIPSALIKELQNTKITYTPSMVTDKFHDIVTNLGIPCRFHDLRHYGATFLHAQGVPDKYIMERGGWSSVNTLQKIYTHTLPNMTNEATQKVTEKFAALTLTK